MPDREPLDDTAAYDVLFAAHQALGTAPGATVRADTALKTARRSMAILMFSLLKASEEGTDTLDAVRPAIGPTDPSPQKP